LIRRPSDIVCEGGSPSSFLLAYSVILFGKVQDAEMLERDMEDLIAAHPKDFFGKEFTLIGRQQSFAGVGRFDLLFKDEFDTNILMELKARVAKYDDASQLGKYKDEMQRQGITAIFMWLVAPHIPQSVREFLDRIGIEYREIHEAEFRRIAQRYGKSFPSQAEVPSISITRPQPKAHTYARPIGQFSNAARIIRRTFNPAQVFTGPMVTTPPRFQWKNIAFDLALGNPQDLDRQRFDQLVSSFETSARSRKNAVLSRELREWASDPANAWLGKDTYFSLLRWVTTSGWKYTVPHAEALWIYLFGAPAPTWYKWNQSDRKYQFDSDAWKTWFDSLRSSLRSTEAIYMQHNDITARNWPVKDQCQCKDCQNYRAAHPSISSL
jgi:Endonuclease NucS